MDYSATDFFLNDCTCSIYSTSWLAVNKAETCSTDHPLAVNKAEMGTKDHKLAVSKVEMGTEDHPLSWILAPLYFLDDCTYRLYTTSHDSWSIRQNWTPKTTLFHELYRRGLLFFWTTVHMLYKEIHDLRSIYQKWAPKTILFRWFWCHYFFWITVQILYIQHLMTHGQ